MMRSQLCQLLFGNVTKTRVTWEAGSSRNCIHQSGVGHGSEAFFFFNFQKCYCIPNVCRCFTCMCVSMYVRMYVCKCTPHVWRGWGDQERALDPMELKSQVAMRCIWCWELNLDPLEEDYWFAALLMDVRGYHTLWVVPSLDRWAWLVYGR